MNDKSGNEKITRLFNYLMDNMSKNNSKAYKKTHTQFMKLYKMGYRVNGSSEIPQNKRR